MYKHQAMRKLYALIAILGSLSYSTAQEIIVDTFENMNVGAVSSNVNGTVMGPGGHYTLAPTGTPNNDFLILNAGGTRGKILQIIGGVDSDRFVWKSGFDTAWAARTESHDIIEVSYEFLTGSASTSKNVIGVALFDQTTEQIIAGLQFHMDTKEIEGLGRYNANGVPTNYTFKLGATTGTAMILPAATWVTVGFSYDKTTGMLRFKGPGFNKFANGATVGVDPNELDYFVTYQPGNTLSGQGRFNDIVAVAVETSTYLDLDTPPSSAEFAIYPNPFVDRLFVQGLTGLAIQSAVVYDALGRTLHRWDLESFENYELDCSFLPAGQYILQLETANGKVAQKILKK